jgi:hypothetical protein
LHRHIEPPIHRMIPRMKAGGRIDSLVDPHTIDPRNQTFASFELQIQVRGDALTTTGIRESYTSIELTLSRISVPVSTHRIEVSEVEGTLADGPFRRNQGVIYGQLAACIPCISLVKPICSSTVVVFCLLSSMSGHKNHVEYAILSMQSISRTC